MNASADATAPQLPPTSPWRAALPCALPPLATVALLALAPMTAVLDVHAALALAPFVAWSVAALVRRRLGGMLTAAAAWTAAAVAVALPPLQLALHGLWLPSCAPIVGLHAWLLGPALAALVSACFALVAAQITPRLPHLGWWVLALLSALPPLWRFVDGPAVASWHPLLGMVPGALYEDALAPDARLLLFRAVDTPIWLALGAWSLARLRGEQARAWLTPIAASVAIAAVVVGAVRGGDDGWRLSRDQLDGVLRAGADLDIDHDGVVDVELRLAASADWRRRAAPLAEDVAVRWLQLRDFFATRPARLRLYVYDNDGQKTRLMGADAVEMAKPWLGEAHLVWPDYGDSIVAHEMAHVFAATWAGGPFGVSMRAGVLPDALRIEGIAVAAEWPTRYGLDPDGEAKAMRQLGLAPDMAALMSPWGFFAANPASAYTLAGSLLRWVHRHCGRAALRQVVAGAELAAACKRKDDAEVLAAWGRSVDSDAGAQVDAAALALAEARFASPGVLARPCLLAIGRCAAEGLRLQRRGAFSAAAADWRALHQRLTTALDGAHLPLGVELAYAAALTRAGDVPAALVLIETRLNATPAPRALDQAILRAARGDLLLAAGDADGARAAWAEAATLAQSEAGQRGLVVRMELSRSEAGAAASRDLLGIGRALGDPGEVVRRLRQGDDGAMARYLAARWTLGEADDASAPEAMEAAATLQELANTVAVPRLVRRACRELLATWAARRGACDEVTRHAAAAGDDATVGHWHHEAAARCLRVQRLGAPSQWRNWR